MTKIDPSLFLHNQTQVQTPNPELGKDEFLKILMTQLQNQDPLDPMDDKEFVSQMATFSSLEQMMQMANSIDTLVQNQKISPVAQYSHLIGKEVKYQTNYGEDEERKRETETGTVVAVSQKDEQVILKLDNDEKVNVDSIVQITESNQEPNHDGVSDLEGSE